MGKGRIVSGGEEGLYTVELLHNRERIEAEIAQLTQLIAELDAELAELETERNELIAARDAIIAQIDAAIAAAVAEDETPDVEDLLTELAQASAAVQAQDVRIALVQGRRLEAVKRKDVLDAVPNDPVQSAWCADFTEDLSGEVATVEVPAEGIVGQFATWRRVQIRPGYSGRAAYSASRDGQMFHREGQVGYQVYYNAALLPGVQRWKPQYRIGTISTIDYEADTCTITIQAEDSSAQSLIIDPPDLQYIKTGVPIEYMECDSDVFEAGDRVLVEFQGRDWSSPKVIGFESNPRECETTWPDLYFKIQESLGSSTFYGTYNIYSATPREYGCATAEDVFPEQSGTYTGYMPLLTTFNDTERTVSVVANWSSVISDWSSIDAGDQQHELYSALQTRDRFNSLDVRKIASPEAIIVDDSEAVFKIAKEIYSRSKSGSVELVSGGNVQCDSIPTAEVWTAAVLSSTETTIDSDDPSVIYNWALPSMPTEIQVENNLEPEEAARAYRPKEVKRVDSFYYFVYEQVPEEPPP